MSDQGSGFPPEHVQGDAANSTPNQGDWQTVPPASAGGAPPPGSGYPPPPSGYAPPGYVPPPGGYPPPGYAQPAAGLSPNTAAALSYITIIPAIIFLVMEPYKRNDFIRFHAWQCIALAGVSVAARIVLMFLGFIGIMMSILVSLAIVVFWLIALVKASQGERYHIPGVGELAEQLTRSVQI
ncbi:MAG: DUF4870 domain-containing protein [Acidobacteriota bacterium]